SLWNLPVVLALNLLAVHLRWWRFDAHGGLFLGMPVELYLAWAWLWGAIPALAFPAAPLSVVMVFALAVDVALMPAAAPVIRLGPSWWLGEVIGLAIGVLPGQLLARWTLRDERLVARTCLQMIAFAGLLLFVLPAAAIGGSATAWVNPATRPAWQINLLAQALAVPALFGLTPVQEFAARGGGAPVPFDPTRRLVTTGVYAYIRNPMQTSAVVLLLMWGAVLGT